MGSLVLASTLTSILLLSSSSPRNVRTVVGHSDVSGAMRTFRTFVTAEKKILMTQLSIVTTQKII